MVHIQITLEDRDKLAKQLIDMHNLLIAWDDGVNNITANTGKSLDILGFHYAIDDKHYIPHTLIDPVF